MLQKLGDSVQAHLHLAPQELDVHSLRPTLQLQGTSHERIGRDHPGPILVKEGEELLGLASVYGKGLEDLLQVGVPIPAPKLADGDDSLPASV